MIVYSVVAGPGGVVLAEYLAAEGNYAVVAKQILENLPSDATGKKSYTYNGYNFHTMIANGITFICVAKDSFGSRIPFGVLDDIQMMWRNRYANKGLDATAYTMNDEFSRTLKTKMDFYSNDSSADKIRAINVQLEEVKSQLMDNLDKVIERGENIERLVTKTEGLQSESAAFKTKANQVKKKDVVAKHQALDCDYYYLVGIGLWNISCGLWIYPREMFKLGESASASSSANCANTNSSSATSSSTSQCKNTIFACS